MWKSRYQPRSWALFHAIQSPVCACRYQLYASGGRAGSASQAAPRQSRRVLTESTNSTAIAAARNRPLTRTVVASAVSVHVGAQRWRWAASHAGSANARNSASV